MCLHTHTHTWQPLDVPAAARQHDYDEEAEMRKAIEESMKTHQQALPKQKKSKDFKKKCAFGGGGGNVGGEKGGRLQERGE